jgi:AAA+ ATPase superfamily predicted ATPase
MRAMAQGQETLSDISKRAGLSGGPASKYLSILRETGFVERRVPVTERSADSRRGRYFVTDPYLRFYYRFLAAYQSKLAMGQQQQMLQYIDLNMPEFIQKNTWQELCREWVLLASAQDELPIPVEEVGSEWKRSFTIDVVGISEQDRSLVLGCCLWNETPADPAPLQELVRRTSAIIPKGEEDWQVYFLGFASGGWSDTAVSEANTIIGDDKTGRSRRKWQAAGIRLLNLAEVDADLERWFANR